MRRIESPTILNVGPVTQVRPAGEVSAPAETHAELDWPRVRGYAVHEVVGSGGMGVVFKATHRELQRVVALKMLLTGAFCEDESRDRFRAEAETVAQLQHPNIIQVFEVGTVEPLPGEVHPSPFIALEFVDGGCLADQTKVPRPPEFAARMVEKLARAVQVAHKHGVIHRDLKPANVLLTADGEPKIADFGLAKRLDAARDQSGRFVTLAGTVMGTPEYMAPEQVDGEGPAPSMDVYALGVILYELLTSRVPHHGATPADTMYMTRFEEPVPPRRLQPSLPRDIDTICMKALAKAPAKRYPSADALADDLGRWLAGRPIAARPISVLGRAERWARRNPAVAALSALVVFVALAGVGGIVWKWREAKDAAAAARAKATEADENAKNERRGRYRAEMIAASSALRVSDVAGARRALEAAPEEHRNWEWRHFRNQFDGQSRVTVLSAAGLERCGLSRDCRRVVGLRANEIGHWDAHTERMEWTGLKVGSLSSFGLSINADRICGWQSDGAVEVWSLNPRRQLAVLPHAAGVWSANFDADGSRLATNSPDKSVRIWEVATGTLLHELKGHPSQPIDARFSPDGRRLATIGVGDRTVRMWDTQTGKLLFVIDGHEREANTIEFAPTGDRLVTNEHYPTNAVRVWDAAKGTIIATLRGHTNQIQGIGFDPTGARLATVSMDQTARLWDRAGKLVAELRGHKGYVNTAAFTPDGTRLLTAGSDKTVRLWDARDGIALAVGYGHEGVIDRVGVSGDGTEAVSVAFDGTARTWDLRKLEAGGVIKGHTNFAYSVAFLPDGARVASASWDGTARLWDVATGRELRSFPHGTTAVMSVAAHHAGRLLATLARDKKVRLWDIETGELLHTWVVDANDWRDSRLAFSPTGDLLAVCALDGAVRLFDVAKRAAG